MRLRAFPGICLLIIITCFTSVKAGVPFSSPGYMLVDIGRENADVIALYSETADAGDDQALCGVVNATLSGNIPVTGSGTWTVVSGPGSVTFGDNTSGISDISVDKYGSYELAWTIDDGGFITVDNVIIDFNEDPTGATAATLRTSAEPRQRL